MCKKVLFLSTFCCILFLVASAGSGLSVTAGKFQTLYLPENKIRLTGKIKANSSDVKSTSWKKIAGPLSFNISDPKNISVLISNLEQGEYSFEFSAIDESGRSGRDTTQIMVYATANVQVPETTMYPNLFGSNPGYYGQGWPDMQIYRIMNEAGCKSTRSTIPMFFFSMYGDSIRYAEQNYFYNTLGFRENVFFLYNSLDVPFPERSEEKFNGEQVAVPKGMYLPIWNEDGTVNMNNSFAKYCYKTVSVYGRFCKYFEVWNEPDFTYNWGVATALRGSKGSWWETDPSAADLPNLKAPPQYYIRMLRVAFEVIKRYKPEAIITLGGLGYTSFLHFVLRSTDNPEVSPDGKRGSVTTAYPLKGGAYFDCLSFHSYPQFYLKYWDYTTKGMGYKRNSDEAIDQTIRDEKNFLKVLTDFGYNGSVYPKKSVICTEINIPRKQLQQDIGGIEVQRNFAWKTIAQAAKNNISQVYWFVTGETVAYDSAKESNGFQLMGLYQNLLSNKPGQEKLTEEGIANRSASMLLSGFYYDSFITRKMNIPPNAEGLAWKNRKTGEVRFMLWARTVTDSSENSVAYYSFPQNISDTRLDFYKWNYFSTGKKEGTTDPDSIILSGEPLIFIKTRKSIPHSDKLPHSKPVVHAGVDTTIRLPFYTFNGNASHPDKLPMNYFWEITRLPEDQGDYPAFKNRNTAHATVIGLKKGIYQFRFSAIDNKGYFSTDSMRVSVE